MMSPRWVGAPLVVVLAVAGWFFSENGDGTATISYVPPSRIFAPYNHPEVKKVAAELDAIFGAIVNRALAAR